MEEAEGPEAGSCGAETTGAAGADPVAVALALGGASREEADAFLRRQGAFLEHQSALIADQRHHLHEQFKHLHLSIWEKRLGVFLRTATAIVGVAVAAGFALMVWDAARSNRLLIEPFSVPPDLAARGLTGEVVANKLQDRLAAMQAQTNSGRPAKSYANSWGEHGIKLDIPDTGISISELDSFLREMLGHDTHVSGEIVRKAAGLALSARAGDQSASSVTGQEEDIDALVQRLAESVYRITQPFRYGMFLAGHNRDAEALPVFEALAKGQDAQDRMWGYGRWALTISGLYGNDAAFPVVQQAIANDSGTIGVYDVLVNYYGSKGRSEDVLQTGQVQLAHLLDGRQTYVSSARIAGWKKMLKARIAVYLGASHDATLAWEDLARSGVPGLPGSYFQGALIGSRTGEHDLAAARTALAELGDPGDVRNAANLVVVQMNLARQAEDWRGLLAIGEAAERKHSPIMAPAVRITPMVAYANARLGRFDAAEAAIAATPAECYFCLRTRGQIAALHGQPGRADFWFARAAAAGPSLPFAELEWGQALLGRGQPDAAIEKFAAANRKSAHFADPLESWGEALMAKSQSHLALAKFAEAEKYAPNWGRLHLKWGEVLVYAGKKDEAKKQFARAGALDLTPAEKSELAKVSHD